MSVRPEARQRIFFVILAILTIAVGLVVHRIGIGLGNTARDIAGDALWAMMIVWWIGAIVPRAFRGARAAAAYTGCVVVEFSQLLHTPTLDAVRSTLLGRLVLGSGFDSRDLVAYAVGVACAVLLERRFVK